MLCSLYSLGTVKRISFLVKGIKNYHQSAIQMWVLALLTCVGTGVMNGLLQKKKKNVRTGHHSHIGLAIPEDQQ